MQPFEMTSSDGTKLSSYKFIPKKIKAVFILLHGSIEHAKRYFEFCDYLCENGIAVYTFDQRGHGQTAKEDDQVAYFSDNDEGWYQAIADVRECVKISDSMIREYNRNIRRKNHAETSKSLRRRI